MVPLNVNITVTKILVVVGHGSDKICIFTDFPDAIPKEAGGDYLGLNFVAPSGKGVEYVRNTFHIEPEVLNLETKRTPFSNKNRDDLDA